MDGLREQFGTQIEFIVLDVDDPASLPLRQQYDMVQRSRYALVAADGTVIQRWFGFLNEAELESYLSQYVASLTP